MGISHPLSDEYDALRGAVLSPERTPPSSPPPPPSSCCALESDDDCLEHPVSRMDTLAGIAIKYGVEIPDIKRANGLVSDSQMYALKTLLIPIPGKPIPSSMRSNGSGQRTKRTWAPRHQQNRDVFCSVDSPKSVRQGTSPAMSTLQRYYGLTSQRGNTMDCSTEMSVYHKGSFQSMASETLLKSTSTPDMPSTDGNWDCDDQENGLSAASVASATKSNGSKQDGSMRRRQKMEADRLSNAEVDFLADPIKAIKSLLPRPISSIRLNMDASNPDWSQKSNNISFLNGFRSVRKSPSAPSFADTENGTSMWSSSTWSFNHESFTRPLLDGLPKPVSARRSKTATD